MGPSGPAAQGGNPPRAGGPSACRKRLGALRGHLGRDQVENLRRAGGPETDPLTGSCREARRHRRRPVFSEARRSRSAGGKAGGSAGHGIPARALERPNPKRASARLRGGSPAGYGLVGRSKTLKLRRTVIFQKNLRVEDRGFCERQEGIGAERRTASRGGARLCRENPRSGTGLKRAGSLLEEQTVEGVRNAEGGPCRRSGTPGRADSGRS